MDKKKPDKWKYQATVIDADTTKGLQDSLDLYGADGWELVTYSRQGTAIFKRRVDE